MNHLLETYSQFPFTLVDGEGVYVRSSEGRRYLDLYGGHAVSVLGHSPRAVIDALTRQAETLFFYSNLAPLKIRDEASSSLMQFLKLPDWKVFFCNSGAEANENALKLALKVTGRSEIIGFKGGFHGRTFLAASVTDNNVWHAQAPAWRGPCQIIEPELFALEAISKDTAAVIVEPIQSMEGARRLSEELLRAVRDRCSEMGALLIFDEVQTGIGRTGVPCVASEFAWQPDIATFAKSIAAGFPCGAMTLSAALSKGIQAGDLGSTFGGGPLAMAALKATIDELNKNDLLNHVKQLDAELKGFSQLAVVTEVTGRGCLTGLRLTHPARDVQKVLLEEGIIVGLSKCADVIRLLPPLIIESEHISRLATALEKIS